jgi:diadenosine tetraphosphate (Ap4A) HIT family hydrolase/5-methylcytosine-specific restriction endonuclease McrA
MRFRELLQFIEKDMRMSHVYQPVMILALLEGKGRASVESIARALLNEDRSQLEYYVAITKNMVGRVLAKRGVAKREDGYFDLVGYERFTKVEIGQLRNSCQKRLKDYLEARGDTPWAHRQHGSYLPGTLRYEVLKSAKFHCELCGVSAEERALEVDHIRPRNKGGGDEIANLQALCYSCNAMKRDRDDTDFRAVRAAFARTEASCPFCSLGKERVVLENALAVAVRDLYPVTAGHMLVIPKRHALDYFDLGSAEQRACDRLLIEARKLTLSTDPTVAGFNVGANVGVAAGQTVMHCHIHLIPRRSGDSPNPRGGVRGVVPGKADYVGDERR